MVNPITFQSRFRDWVCAIEHFLLKRCRGNVSKRNVCSKFWTLALSILFAWLGALAENPLTNFLPLCMDTTTLQQYRGTVPSQNPSNHFWNLTRSIFRKLR